MRLSELKNAGRTPSLPLTLDLADAGESRGPVLPVSIAGVLRYIESFKALALPLRYVFVGGSGNQLFASQLCREVTDRLQSQTSAGGS